MVSGAAQIPYLSDDPHKRQLAEFNVAVVSDGLPGVLHGILSSFQVKIC